MKLQHYIGGLEGLGLVAFERKVFVESWEIPAATMGAAARPGPTDP